MAINLLLQEVSNNFEGTIVDQVSYSLFYKGLIVDI